MMLRVGYHVSKSTGLHKNIEILIAEGGRAVQFFLSPKEGFHPGIPLKDAEVASILKLKEEYNLYLVVHGKYILNYSRPYSEKTKWQRQALITDMTQAYRLGANVIIHQGKNVKDLNFTRLEALYTFVDNLKNILAETGNNGINNKILLENSCQQGTELGYTIEELAEIYHKFTPSEKERIGFCLDLCHVFVSGTLNVASIEEIDKFFSKFDEIIGLNKLEVIHFNDSRIRFDGHNDNHEDILVGHIGNPHISQSDGFRHIVQISEKLGIPLILETPSYDQNKNPNGIPYSEQIQLLSSWSQQNSNPEYETEYITKHQTRIFAFAEATKPKPKILAPKPKRVLVKKISIN